MGSLLKRRRPPHLLKPDQMDGGPGTAEEVAAVLEPLAGAAHLQGPPPAGQQQEEQQGQQQQGQELGQEQEVQGQGQQQQQPEQAREQQGQAEQGQAERGEPSRDAEPSQAAAAASEAEAAGTSAVDGCAADAGLGAAEPGRPGTADAGQEGPAGVGRSASVPAPAAGSGPGDAAGEAAGGGTGEAATSMAGGEREAAAAPAAAEDGVAAAPVGGEGEEGAAAAEAGAGAGRGGPGSPPLRGRGRRGRAAPRPPPFSPAAAGCRLVAVRLTVEEAFFLHHVLRCLQVRQYGAPPASMMMYGMAVQVPYGGSTAAGQIARGVYELQAGAPLPATAEHVRRLDSEGLWRACRAARSSFVTSYVAYHHLKAKGWIPRSGLLYGVDYVVYQLHPVGAHSDFGVMVVPLAPGGGPGGPHAPPLGWLDLQITNRLINQVCKRLVLLYVYDMRRHGGGEGEGQQQQQQQPEGREADHGSLACLQDFLVEERIVRRWVPDATRD
ncbi:tRNA-splicing endonuclease subunit Sen2-1 [Tetrabaena socialis]|uniref:tRNA-intron lyase n=1 Tax=Tetrabaena socialis TaxID=47790 RepID=A0A2J8A952_9CHLO|nr:tRNA-splicing endonuclease subunit Sen2-1 [Tetrabaena socialis]|eukprot:PNH09056.1 tRNA-splicing endonuclease subunit Sen2-1 [Tetrabaena socialis]